jgi:alcohol dehydrogenase
MENYSFKIPQDIIFGMNKVEELASLIKRDNLQQVLLVSDRTLEKLGYVERIMSILEKESVKVIPFLDVEPNPSIETVNQATATYKENKCDSIVALGGGSPMDVAKSVGVLAQFGGEISEYEGAHKVPGKIVPLIAIPTTAGTGSEVTAFSVITDKKRNYKLTVFSYELIPSHAIIDPSLIMSLPPAVAASTGIDALVHAMEAYLSKAASPFTDAMAEKAIALIGANIRLFVADRTNEEAASAMISASTFAGIAFAWARLGNVHAMAHPLSGFFNVPHGVANAILLPTILEYNALADNGRYEKMYELITGKHINDFKTDVLVRTIKELLSDLGIARSLSEVGVKADKIPEMAIDAMKSGNILVNPRQSTVKDIENLYHLAMNS